MGDPTRHGMRPSRRAKAKWMRDFFLLSCSPPLRRPGGGRRGSGTFDRRFALQCGVPSHHLTPALASELHCERQINGSWPDQHAHRMSSSMSSSRGPPTTDHRPQADPRWRLRTSIIHHQMSLGGWATSPRLAVPRLLTLATCVIFLLLTRMSDNSRQP